MTESEPFIAGVCGAFATVSVFATVSAFVTVSALLPSPFLLCTPLWGISPELYGTVFLFRTLPAPKKIAEIQC